MRKQPSFVQHKSNAFLQWLLLTGALRLSCLLALLSLFSCNSEKKTLTSKAYHNFHAYFNGFYHANLRYKEATASLEKAVEPPTDGFMPLLDPVAEKPSDANVKLLDEAIKKCEVLIYRRKHSDWVDDARFLIGRCWYYKRNWGMAQTNFDYLRFAYKGSDLTPAVILWQAKTQYQYENFWNTKRLLDELLKQPNVDRDVRAEASLIYADLLVRDGEYSLAAKVLDDDLDNMRGKRNLARVNYLLGQLYDKLAVFPKSLEHYLAADRINYSDALSFRARLAVINLKIKYQPENDLNLDLASELDRLASESRFTNFQDEIFYQRALLSIKENKHKEAIQFLKLSIARSKGNAVQKTLSYFKCGELLFGKFNQLAAAQAYLDSAATLAKPELADYKKIQSMSRVLGQYVGYKKTIRQSDSLLYLSHLTDNELDEVLDKTIADADVRLEMEAAKKAEEAKQRPPADNAGANASAGPTFGSTPSNAGSFYYDNLQLVESGRAQFIKQFGSRPNEDNWRRRNKERVLAGAADNQSADAKTPRSQTRQSRRDALRQNVPRDTASIHATERQLADALSALAALFKEELQMPDSAYRTHTEVLQRFPNTLFAARALYALYRLYKDERPESARAYADLVLREYPQSQYALLIRNENKKTKLEAGDSETAYEGLWGLYNNADYKTVINFVKVLEGKFGKEDAYTGRLLYLKAMAFARMQQPDSMLAALRLLVAEHPTDPAAARAKQTLASYENRAYLSNLPRYEFNNNAPDATNKPTGTPEDIKAAGERFRDFNLRKQASETLMGVALIEATKIGQKELVTLVENYNKRKFAQLNISVNVFEYQGKHLLYLAQFNDFAGAFAYIDALRKEPTLAALVNDPAHDIVFATPLNFRIAFAQRRFDHYLDFFAAMQAEWRNEK